MFSFIKKGLEKTLGSIKDILPERVEKIDKTLLEEILIESDIPYELVEEILYYLPPSSSVARADVRRVLKAYFTYKMPELSSEQTPFVELVIGVNGAGKTTTIAKLAHNYKKASQSVLLGAADTFRAAAIEQLKSWAERVDVGIVYTAQGHDPSAVAYDTISSAIAKKIDRVIIDTAGRLHNQVNLANELKKIVRICDKALLGAPHRKILILDGTQGTSAINQAKAFHEMIGIDAIIITKLDGTAKGGSLFGIAKALELPILYVGVGEGKDDLIPFNSDEYVDTILDAIFTPNHG
ncbi:signal recognition particle-docking protein FtsY [Sulfurospirillum sp. hDNRA2]|jgi:fused signal recognition particle receptor|uniref:Signal recognition particle receptor FtsY n=1 Tax=Sulfurospirillum cavolei TaxID=366522 RepID=A0A2D3W7P3_9BACT|nr:signal recognition particle-docking protein FtsY [Sulfurospirillum sp. DNRA8]MCP3651535.1 signal recognition particle-docking protein FtsY [Sulfurospirillum sp. DNRA8]MCR1810382.1 signal recognition particle-docking protein FtsY [Sulfurospirillum sp. DNRA8]DAB36418.1 MAG TPA: signal recognition particle-docking protein FtsY [Sulfurospirillum cavolei]